MISYDRLKVIHNGFFRGGTRPLIGWWFDTRWLLSSLYFDPYNLLFFFEPFYPLRVGGLCLRGRKVSIQSHGLRLSERYAV